MSIYNRNKEELILTFEEESALEKVIEIAISEDVHSEQPKYIYSNQMDYHNNTGKHIIRFTAPLLVLSDNEAVIVYDGTGLVVDMKFYTMMNDISVVKEYTFYVD